jgi:hypothetical protein
MAVAVETRNRTREKEISGYLLRSGPSATRGVAAARTPRPGRTGSARCPSGALDFEQAELGGDAAGGGKSAGLAAGGDDAMARHDDGERISPQRLADFACRAGIAEPGRDVAKVSVWPGGMARAIS